MAPLISSSQSVWGNRGSKYRTVAMMRETWGTVNVRTSEGGNLEPLVLLKQGNET